MRKAPSQEPVMVSLAESAGKVAVLVNSSDGFSDCWSPFFTLFERYGAGLRSLPIYLNTERLEFSWPGLDLRTTCVRPHSEVVRPTWSECFRRALQSVSEPYLIYFQEDYFLTREVDDSAIAQALAVLEADPLAGVAYLFRIGPLYTRALPYNNLFVQVVPPSRYLVSTQCAIWRKDFLFSLLREWENGWMFEIFGSHRAKYLLQQFLAVQPKIAESSPIVDYVYTGVIKGRWHQDCVPLFREHGIEIDFAHRGMYGESGALRSKLEVGRKLAERPSAFLRSIFSVLAPLAHSGRGRVS